MGRTRLQKEVFLAQKALKDKKIPRKYGFMPYHYGPFSRQLYFDINLLRAQGLVEEKTHSHPSGVFREFKLTSQGARDVESMIHGAQFKKIYETVRAVKRKYDDMPLVDLVELTHREFPEYVGEITQY